MTTKKISIAGAILFMVAFGIFSLAGQKFINGSFEPRGDPGCRENISNQAFNSLMPDVIGLGEVSKLDLYNFTCGKGAPIEGNYFVGLEAEAGLTDAIAIPLDENIVPNKFYYIEFYARLDAETKGEYNLALGVNINSTSHGNLLFTFRDMPTRWQKYTLLFRTPIVAKYVTVLIETRDKAKIYIDDFKFSCPRIDLGRDTTYCAYEERLLEISKSFTDVQWNDGSSDFTFTPTVPGIYSVKANFGACALQDTIRLIEDPALCACKIYVPNIFNTESQPPNNTFKVRANCDLKAFNLEIFDRWGNIVFQSEDPNLDWNGMSQNKKLPPGTYICAITYLEDIVNNKLRREISTVTLVR